MDRLPRRVLLVSGIAACWAAYIGVAFADPVGKGTFRVEGDSVTGEFCVQIQSDNFPVNPLGTPVNLATSSPTIFCTGDTTPPPISGHCVSMPDGTQLSYDFQITSQAGKAAGFAFVGNVTNLAGDVPAAIAADWYTFDGTASTQPLPLAGTTIPGCSITANGYFVGVTGLNAFRQEAVAPGGPATVNATPSFTNPDTGQVETLTVDVSFADVTGSGNVLVSALSSVDGLVPPGFSLDLAGFRPSFLEISTDATITPPITICQHYADDAPDDGIVDGTTLSEDLLTMLHGEGLPLAFVDRTSSRDPVDNIVCAEVASLSPFVVAAAVPVNHDSVVVAPPVVRVTIGENGATVTRKLPLTVRNADLSETAGHEIELAVTSSTCPPSLLLDEASQPLAPDFIKGPAASSNRANVAGGKAATAQLPLRVVAADHLSPNAKSPTRCFLTVTATSLDDDPVAEVNPSNNTVQVTVEVVDKSDF